VQSRCRDSVEVVQMWFRGGAEQVQSRGAEVQRCWGCPEVVQRWCTRAGAEVVQTRCKVVER
jgi:hypothetical protein